MIYLDNWRNTVVHFGAYCSHCRRVKTDLDRCHMCMSFILNAVAAGWRRSQWLSIVMDQSIFLPSLCIVHSSLDSQLKLINKTLKNEELMNNVCEGWNHAPTAATVVRPSHKYFQCWVIAFDYMFDFSEYLPETFMHFFFEKIVSHLVHFNSSIFWLICS